MTRYSLLLLILFFMSDLAAQRYPITTEPDLHHSNDIRNHLTRVAGEVTDNSPVLALDSLNQWEDIREAEYHKLVEMLSLVDVPLEGERPPLNIKVTGTIRQDGYRIEKLYYESLPDLYVPANLYIPEGEGPFPAILYVCGHSRTQKANYQAHARRFAQLGFVCLIFETIQWGEVRGEHWGPYSLGKFHWYSRGYNPGGVETWNGIRGLDLLEQHPKVDAGNMGVTGISGGGAYSWYIAALDDRIKAAAPVCGTGTIEAHVHERTLDGHCDCMMPLNTYSRDVHDMGALFAPKPLLIASADRDGLFSIESVRESYGHMKNIYRLYGARDAIQLIETPGGHSYHEKSRTAIFSFFLKHLAGKDVPPSEVGDIDESESAQLSVEELAVYTDGPPADDRTTTIQETFVKAAEPPGIKNTDQLNTHRKTVIDFLNEKTFHAFPENPVPLDIRREFRTLDGARHGGDIFSFVSETDWRLRMDIRWRQPESQQSPTVLVLRSPDEGRWASVSFVSDLDDRYNVAYFETRGVGANGWSTGLQWHVRRASAWAGRTVASMQVYDVLRALQTLRQINGVSDNEIVIAARDGMAAVALYAALLDGNVAGVILDSPPETQNTPGREDGRDFALEMLNCLRITDVPQVAGLLYPARIAMVGDIPETYQWSENLYKSLGEAENFQFIRNVSEY